MSEANKMLEELGYQEKKLDFILSNAWEEWGNVDLAKTFYFNFEYKTFDFTDESGCGITMEELQAINAKVKEFDLVE